MGEGWEWGRGREGEGLGFWGCCFAGRGKGLGSGYLKNNYCHAFYCSKFVFFKKNFNLI